MKDKKDKIIKIVLIIIIILLLIRNCALLKKKGNVKTPSGNVNIIEIICDSSDDKCDVEEDNKNVDNKEQGSDNGNEETSATKRNKVDNNKATSDNKTTNNSSSNNNSGTSNNGSGTDSDDNNDEPEVEEVAVFDKRVTWEDTTELKIFTNSVYTMEGKIAPEDSNTYQFVVKNSTNYNLKYDVSFIETNARHINMKYKLKKNNTYIVDHYVSYNELNLSDQLLNAKTNDTYYLEWKWISSDNDNEIGEIGAEYKLDIKVEAESTND